MGPVPSGQEEKEAALSRDALRRPGLNPPASQFHQSYPQIQSTVPTRSDTRTERVNTRTRKPSS